jgi:hypothetical protein
MCPPKDWNLGADAAGAFRTRVSRGVISPWAFLAACSVLLRTRRRTRADTRGGRMHSSVIRPDGCCKASHIRRAVLTRKGCDERPFPSVGRARHLRRYVSKANAH